MAPGSSQKRFSRSTGLRRFSSLRAGSSPPLQPPSSSQGKKGAYADGGASSTSFILPDRSRAREFIRHISNSSTSSSEYSLSAAISPPPPQQSPPPPLPTQSFLSAASATGKGKSPSRKGSVVSIGASSTRTFPHGQVFDTSSPPISPGFLGQPESTPPKPAKRIVNVLDRPRSGMAGIGAGGSARQKRAALMAVDSEIFSTGGTPMFEPGTRKEMPMLSLKAAQQEQYTRNQSEASGSGSSGAAAMSSSHSSTLQTPRRQRPDASRSPTLPRNSTPATVSSLDADFTGDFSRVVQTGHGQNDSRTSSESVSSATQRRATKGGQNLAPESATSGALSADALTTLAGQMRRRSRSVNKIISSDVANGWQLLWTLATADSNMVVPDAENRYAQSTPPPEEKQEFFPVSTPLALRTSTAPSQETSNRGAGQAKDLKNNASSSTRKSEQQIRNTPTPISSPLPSSTNTPNESVAQRTRLETQPLRLDRRPGTLAYKTSSSDSGPTLNKVPSGSISSGSVKSNSSLKPQAAEIIAPRRPPRSAKRVSVLWGPSQPASAVPPKAGLQPKLLPLQTESPLQTLMRRSSNGEAPYSPTSAFDTSFATDDRSTDGDSDSKNVNSSSGPEISDQSFASAVSYEDEKSFSTEATRETGLPVLALTSKPQQNGSVKRVVEEKGLDRLGHAGRQDFGLPKARRERSSRSPTISSQTVSTAVEPEADGEVETQDESYSDLEIVAMTETERSETTSSNGDAPSVHTHSGSPQKRLRSRDSSANSAQRALAFSGHQMAPPSTSVRSLIEVLAEGDRVDADAHWEMLTGARTSRSFPAANAVTGNHIGDGEIFDMLPGIPESTSDEADTESGRNSAMKAVEMWRRLAESYEMGELSTTEAIESAPTPAGSILLGDEESEALFSISPELPGIQKDDVFEAGKADHKWGFPTVPRTTSQTSSGLRTSRPTQEFTVPSLSSETISKGYTPMQVWIHKEPASLSTPAPGLDFERSESDSNPSTFNTPMPGGFAGKFSPATTPLFSSISTKSKPGLEDVSEDVSMSTSAERTFDSSQQGLGLIFASNSITPPSSYGHKEDEPSWEEEAEKSESKTDEVEQEEEEEELTDNVAANATGDSGSVAASDCFESADEGSERDWGSRRASQGSRRSSSAVKSRTSATFEAVTPANLTGLPQGLEAPANSHLPSARVTSGGRPSTIKDLVMTSQLVERQQFGKGSASFARKPPVQPRGRDMPSPIKADVAGPSRAETPTGTMGTFTMKDVMGGNSPYAVDKDNDVSFSFHSRDNDEDDYTVLPMASLAHTQPIPQHPWITSPVLEGANSEPEAHNMALLRLAKANRRRSNVPRVRNSIIMEEPNDAEVLSARRASKRLSKMGLIDMSSTRVVEKTKSITARQRLTAYMNATPILLVEPPSHNSWRSNLSVPVFQDLLDQWGPLEMHRQEVLWELCETERLFVQAICSVQKIFALPLRTPEGRWIKGVPCSVARLFDWLEDIFQLHCKIHSTLQRARQQQAPILVHIADQLLRCIPKLEAHQPYLVRFESVTQTIEEMLRSENSVFGQFIKMQMQIPECNSMSFSSFLLKPVQRLMKYPLFFKQLAELTPSTHPDHHATQSLLQTTDQVIRDMNDVKAREEDYRDLKLLQNRIKGLPDGFHLATRERRLLRQGQITCVQLTPKEKVQLGLTLNLADTQQGLSSSLPNSPLLGLRSGSLPTEVKDGPSGTHKSHIVAAESIHSQSSTLSGASMGTSNSEWDSYVSVDPPLRNGRPGSFMSTGTSRSESSASFPASSPTIPARDQLDRLVTAKSTARKTSMANILMRKEKQKDRETVLQAFVFSDLVVLTTQDDGQGKTKPLRKSKPTSAAQERASKASALNVGYELVNRIGLARILKVTDHSGRCSERPHLLELEVLPLKVDSSYSSSFDKRNVASGPATLFISFQASGQESSSMSAKSPEQDSVLWYRALERSFLWSLRSRKRNSLMYSSKRESMLSMASSGLRVQNQTAHADWPRRADQVMDLVMAAARAGDAENLASLIQAGLPFPKSPSQQDLATFASEELRVTHSKLYGKLSELSGPTGEANHIPVVGFGILDEAEEEREERRWWALRLTEVRQAAEADREIDAMVEQLRSDTSSSHHSPALSIMSDQQQMLTRQNTTGGRRKVRQGVPVLRSFANNFSSEPSSSATMTSVVSTEYRDV
ncbi:hypothetical protein A4X09_0g1145 [Tilletia walkeri]|uniref:DH domain-containing protein n=1 Tax=Tilletia walkeri TaxID=117179 RepID=A0A8X7T8A9_9BASI|nr:hypothetical protein A4X09_0g1145 [Tilletia walkeri]